LFGGATDQRMMLEDGQRIEDQCLGFRGRDGIVSS
jgi:hypothetical protein